MFELRCDYCELKWFIEVFIEIRSVLRRCVKVERINFICLVLYSQ